LPQRLIEPVPQIREVAQEPGVETAEPDLAVVACTLRAMNVSYSTAGQCRGVPS
jgi:hypothetical protein